MGGRNAGNAGKGSMDGDGQGGEMQQGLSYTLGSGDGKLREVPCTGFCFFVNRRPGHLLGPFKSAQSTCVWAVNTMLKTP